MKILTYLSLFLFLNKNLYAQAFPIYNSILDQENKFSLEKSIKISLPPLSVASMGAFFMTRIHPSVPENIPMNNLAFEQEAIEEELENVFVEETANEVGSIGVASVSTLGIVLILSVYYPLIKDSYNNLTSKQRSFVYNYFITNSQGEKVCRGSKSFFSATNMIKNEFLISTLNWEELMSQCNHNMKYGETYFIKLIDPLGNVLINGKKIVPIEN